MTQDANRRTTSLRVCMAVWMGLLAFFCGCAGRSPAPPSAPLPPTVASQPLLPPILFTIQVGAFSTPDRAARYADQLRADGLDAYYFIDSDGLAKVRFERFENPLTARQRALHLQSKGIIDVFYIARPAAAAPAGDPSAELRQRLVDTARRFLGTPYRWGGESAKVGFDCSGLTMTVYRLNGLELPRNSRSQFRAGTPVDRSAIRMGDLVFFATGRGPRVSHVGIYSGRGRFIHAPGTGKRIRVESLSGGYYADRYVGARRYL